MIENSIVYRDFRAKYDYLPLSRAEGSLIWDRNGKRYVDFTSAWNVTNLGWNHPEVNQAVVDQARKNVQGLLWGSDPIQEEYAAALTSALPTGLDACVKETGGTESVEVSIKVARAYTNRKKIIGFRGLYHGQLFASQALGALAESRAKIAPLVPEIESIPYPHEGLSEKEFGAFARELEQRLSADDVAAIVTEPGIITGGGSTQVAYPGFLTRVRELTKNYGTLLIVDEVGTGFSRTGKLFGIEHEGVVPDMIALAKGISNGAAAIGTVVGRPDIFEPAFIDAILVSTFGWTPVACAAALQTLHLHQRDNTAEMAAAKGKYMMDKLNELVGDTVLNVHGRGLEIGVEVKDDATAERIQKACFADGLHVVVGSANNIQLMPPLTIPQELLDEGLGILIKHAQS